MTYRLAHLEEATLNDFIVLSHKMNAPAQPDSVPYRALQVMLLVQTINRAEQDGSDAWNELAASGRTRYLPFDGREPNWMFAEPAEGETMTEGDHHAAIDQLLESIGKRLLVILNLPDNELEVARDAAYLASGATRD